jgi:hypothetical protein
MKAWTHLFFRHNALVFKIALVAQKKLIYCARGVLLDVSEPVGDVLEGIFFRDVEHEQDAHCIPVVRCGNGPEPFLPCSVQQLQFDLLAVQIDRSKLKVDADGGGAAQVKRVVGKAQQQAALAYSAVPDQHQLDQVVIA